MKDPDARLFVYSQPKDVACFSDDKLAKADSLFDEATKLAASDPVAAEYVAKEHLCLMYVKLVLHPSVGDDFKQFTAGLKRLWHHANQ